MKVWTNNKFTGHYPIGAAAVVVAESAEDAAFYLALEFKKCGLKTEFAKAGDFEELPLKMGHVTVLCDGNY